MPSRVVAIEAPTGIRVELDRVSALTPGAADTLARIDTPISVVPGAHARANGPEPFVVAVGPFVVEVALDRQHVAASARISLRLRNASKRPEAIERVALGVSVAMPGPPVGDWAYLKNGWQSWSLTDVGSIVPEGDAPFPSGAWLRGMHHAVGERSQGRDDWHESHTVSVARAGASSVLAGVLETGRQFGIVNLRRVRRDSHDALELENELVVERMLEPGETIELEEVWLAVGPDPNRLLEAFATRWGGRAGARTRAPFQAGWCSWYHYFHDVSEEALLSNLDALAERRDELPISVVQLDDGYQRAIGDWLEVNSKFPRGLSFVAERIRDAGFAAGLWTAPFSAVRHSRLLARNPDWALRGDDDEWLRGTSIAQWSDEGWCYALDPSHPGLRAHLESLYAELVGMGFTYQKLDFLYMAAMRGRAHDPSWTRAERLARGLDAVRAGAGDDAFLLGCGCPLGAAVGRVDGMRIGPDVAPHWSIEAEGAIPGLEPALPATGSALRSITTRLWMHRRLWQGDPDCLMARRSDTGLSHDEVDTLARAIAVSGGLVVFSDDVTLLGREEMHLVRETIRGARAVDAAALWGGPRRIDLLGVGPAPHDERVVIEAPTGKARQHVEVNLGESVIAAPGGPIEPHASRVSPRTVTPSVAVFCDFDGTFVRQDVGSGIARRYLASRREALFARYEAGEFDAWTYVEALFGGFDLSENERLAFLGEIEIDPGAAGLVDLCDRAGWPFEVLSDGFDLNIEWLRERFAIDFGFRSNGLVVGAQGWQLTPGGRNADCGCGTGLCKRAVLAAFRVAHPDTLVVHVGNGRISDLCAALEADRAFAKDTLPGALERAGRPYTPFETLHDVSAALAPLAGPAAVLGASPESR